MKKKILIAFFVALAIYVWFSIHNTSIAFEELEESRRLTRTSQNQKQIQTQVETLQIKLEKVYMASQSHAAFDLRFINTSNTFLSHWRIKIEIYGKNGQYLGCGDAMVSNMPPGASKIDSATLLDINYRDIDKWSVCNNGIVGENGLRIDRQFDVVIIE